jgi:hypothetical protein
MNKRSTVIIASGTIVTVLLGVAWRSISLAHQTETLLLQIADRGGSLETAIGIAEKRIAAAKNAHQSLEAALARPKKRRSQPATSGLTMYNARSAALRSNPKLQTLWLKAERAYLGINYRPLFQSLRLSPEQIGKFEDIMMEHTEQEMDLSATAEAQGLANTDPAISALRRQYADQSVAATTSLLGAVGQDQLREFDRTTGVRDVVGQVAGLVASTSPLSGDQGTQLIQLLANSSNQYQAGGLASVSSIDWNSVLPQVQGILSPSQMTALQTMRAKDQMAQMLSKLRQLVAQAKGN